MGLWPPPISSQNVVLETIEGVTETMRKNTSSPSKSNSKVENERELLATKLKSINDRLHKVHETRKKLSPVAKYSIASKSTKLTNRSRKKKRMLYHPKLDLIIAENCYSPYLTKPTRQYSEKTLHIPLQVKELRFCGSDANAEGFPVKMEKARRIFMKEIIEYKAHFEFHEEKTNLPMQYINPPPEFFIPDVHAKPRQESMVYPNSYSPLKGHTGKLPHLAAFLRHNPNRPKTTPSLLRRAESVEDYERILEDLEARRPGTSPSGPPVLLRQSSGSLRAHAGRGGPEKYKQEVLYQKAVKELKRMISTSSADGDDHSFGGGGLEAFPLSQDEGEDSDMTLEKEWALDVDLAVVHVRGITCENLKCDSVGDSRCVYATLKYGKIWSAKTPPMSVSSCHTVELLSSAHTPPLAFQVTREAVSTMRLSVTVHLASNTGADSTCGSCKLMMSDLLLKNRSSSTLTQDIITKAGDKAGVISVLFEVMSKEEYDALTAGQDCSESLTISVVEPPQESAVDKEITDVDQKEACKPGAVGDYHEDKYTDDFDDDSKSAPKERHPVCMQETAVEGQAKGADRKESYKSGVVAADHDEYVDDFDDDAKSSAKGHNESDAKGASVTSSQLHAREEYDDGVGVEAKTVMAATDEDIDHDEDFEGSQRNPTASMSHGGSNSADDLTEMVTAAGSPEDGSACLGGALEGSYDDENTQKSGTASGLDLHERSLFYDLSVDGDLEESGDNGLSTKSMMLGESGLMGLGVDIPDGEDSKNTMLAVMEDMLHEGSNIASDSVAAGAGEAYDDDFIYEDDDDDGSFVSAEIQQGTNET